MKRTDKQTAARTRPLCGHRSVALLAQKIKSLEAETQAERDLDHICTAGGWHNVSRAGFADDLSG
jgi:hypothetical protein